MVHVPFDVKSVGFDQHVLILSRPNQHGRGDANNNNEAENDQKYHYFRSSTPYQRGFGGAHPQIGRGLGNVLRGIWRMLLPVLKIAGAATGRELISASQRVLDKVSSGESGIKQAVVSEGKKSVKNLLERAGLEPPPQLGSGKKRKSKSKGPYIPGTSTPLESHQLIVGRTAVAKPPPVSFAKSFLQKPSSKRQRIDTFGLY